MKRLSSKFRNLSLGKKILAVFLIIIFLIFAGNTIYSKTKKPGYKTEKATRDDIVEMVSESGSISTNGKIDIYSPTTGIVEEIMVSNGDMVGEDQELFKVKSSATDQEKQAAYADYMAAKSTLETAQATLYSLQSSMFSYWDTYKNLAENDTYEKEEGVPDENSRTLPEFQVAQKDWLAAEANYKTQQDVISKAQAQVNSTWLLYQATQNATVKTPISGTVSNLSVSVGSSVMVNTPLSPTEQVMSVGNFSTVEAVLSLSEDDIVKIQENQNAEIKADAVNNKTYEGIVKRFDSIGTDVNGVVKYKVYIEITNPDEKIRPGMSIDADIVTKKLSNVLTVPNSAIKPYKGGKAVRVPGKQNGDVEYTPVQVGARGDLQTEIIEGLTEGQTIITALTNGEAKKSGAFGF